MSSGYISLTQKCPHRCINCPLQEKNLAEKDLSLEEIKTTVEEGLTRGLTSVVLSGGEPTSHSQIIDVVRLLAQYPVKVSFLTTCVAFANPRFMEKLLGVISPDRVRIATAIHSYNPELNDHMTRSRGSLRRAIGGMLNAVNAGISTTLKHLITKPTCSGMQDFMQRSYETFPDCVTILLCNIDYAGVAYASKNELMVSFDESRPFVMEALDYVTARRTNGSRRHVCMLDTPFCALPERYWEFLHSQANMKIPVYNDPKHRVAKGDLPNASGPFFGPCYRCSKQACCPGTWPSVKGVFGEKIFIPFV